MVAETATVGLPEGAVRYLAQVASHGGWLDREKAKEEAARLRLQERRAERRLELELELEPEQAAEAEEAAGGG